MKKTTKRTYSVYFGGELFSLKHLIGNAWLAEVPTTRGMDGGMSKPTTPPVMKKVTIRQ